MKKILLVVAIALLTHRSDSQTATNTFPGTGPVGIGTTSPQSTLHINGTFLMDPNGNNYSEGLRIHPSSANDYSTVILGAVSGTTGTGAGQWDLIRYPTANNNLFGIRYYNTDYFNITNTGNVGIGTTSPAAPLDLNGANVGIKQLIYGSGGDIGYYMGFGVNLGQAPNTLTAFIGPPAGDGSSGPASFSIASATSEWPYTGYTTRFTVLSTGNVLIGKTSQTNSTYMLDVNGNVRANSVVINSTGADFVFKSSYKLKPLADLKTYIDQNHHLPEIESAKKMQADGLNVGDNQTKLLQKIEELTLYVIQQDKKNKDQSTQIKAQQLQLDRQQQDIAELKNQMTQLIELSTKK